VEAPAKAAIRTRPQAAAPSAPDDMNQGITDDDVPF
jgi:hypothetical protein